MNVRKKHLSVLISGAMVPLRAGDEGDAPQLNLSYDSIDQIPEAYRPLYTEQDGNFRLTQVVGMKTQDDINNLQGALNKERNDHKAVKTTLAKLGGRDIDEVLTQLDSIPALQAAAKGADNLDEQIAGKLEQATAPLQRNIDDLTSQLNEAKALNEQYASRETRRTVGDAIGKAASAAKALPEAIEDIAFMANAIFEVDDNGNVVAKTDVQGITPGISPEVWLTELKRSKPFYFPASQGAGGKGGQGGQGGGTNPFSKDGWNMTKQGEMVRTNPQLAEQMAAQAGTKVGGPRPQ